MRILACVFIAFVTLVVAIAEALVRQWDPRINASMCEGGFIRPAHGNKKNNVARPPLCKLVEMTDGTILIYRLNPKAGSLALGMMLKDLLLRLDERAALRRWASLTMVACDDPTLERARESGQAFELSSSREPLARFVSGFFYARRHWISPVTHLRTNESDARVNWLSHPATFATQLTAYLTNNLVKEDNWHIFQQSHFLCRPTCPNGEFPRQWPENEKNYDERASRLPPSCGPPPTIHYVIPVENLTTEWPNLVSAAFSGRTALPKALAAAEAAKQTWQSRERPHENAKKDEMGFHAALVRSKMARRVLCTYLEPDYGILNEHPLPSFCLEADGA